MDRTKSTGSTVDTETFTVTRTIDIAAPTDRVWSAVTEPEHVSRWFGRTELDGAGEGATGTMTFGSDAPIPLRVEALDAPHSVTYRWSNDDALGVPPAELDEERSTTFTFTLEPLDASHTRLTVVETGFERTSDPLGNLERHRTGWDGELDKLVALVEAS